MANIGAALTSPETGWQRVDTTNAKIQKPGWLTSTATEYSSGSSLYTDSTTSAMTFRFYGTQLRLIASLYQDRGNVSIVVDGKSYTYSAYSSTRTFQALVFELKDLPLATHQVQIKKIDATYVEVDAVDIDATGYMVATVGDLLSAPEPGWKRIDSTYAKIRKAGWLTTATGSPYTGGTSLYTDNNALPMTFTFYGTKLRIIGAKSNGRGNVKIVIDGVETSYNAYSDTTLLPVLTYEKTGLILGPHTVSISRIDGIYVEVDAIDIDDSGYMLGKVGDPMPEPEPGWKRYDDKDARLTYTGSWTLQTEISSRFYMNNWTQSTAIGNTIRFVFYGSSIRLMTFSGAATSGYNVKIDGVNLGDVSTVSSAETSTMTYENKTLTPGFHTVELTVLASSLFTGSTQTRVCFDAVDLGVDGYLTYKVGDRLTSPEEGWVRTDEPNIKFTGSSWIKGESSANYFNSTTSYSSAPNAAFTFSFVGTAFRIIDVYASNRSQLLEIDIDGVKSTYTSYTTAASTYQNIVYEKRGLSYSRHTVTVTNKETTTTRFICVDAIDVMGYLTTSAIGESLTVPEAGWTRYDDNNLTSIVYTGSWSVNTADAGHSGSTAHLTSTLGDKIEFGFIGTGIRILSSLKADRSTNIKISIDDSGETFTANNGGAATYRSLAYQKLGLEDKYHKVTIVNDSLTTNTNFTFDAVDIAGRLMHPQEVTDVKDLKVGKRIRCHYEADDANLPGRFSGLGVATADYIPQTGASVPNGDFNFIAVEDRNGDLKLIPDRALQIGVPWSALNEAGYAAGAGSAPVTLQSFVPKMTNETSPEGYTARASSTYTATTGLAFNAFGKTAAAEWIHSPNVSPVGQWLMFTAPRAYVLKRYVLTVGSFGSTDHATAWRIEGSNDNGASWETVDSRSGYNSWSDYQKRTFDVLGNTKAYSSYRFYVVASNSGKYARVGELDLLGVADWLTIPTYLRLMTGGTASTETNSEWYRYIVSSTLDNTISAGSDVAWGWSYMYTLTASTATSSATSRVVRGKGTVDAIASVGATEVNSTSGAVGFRPILILKSFSTIEPPEEGPESNALYEVSSGLIYEDNFDTLNSRWTATPVGSYSITDIPGSIRLKHHTSLDTMLLADVGEGDFAVEVFAEYDPVVEGDQGGILLWKNSVERLEFLETYSSASTDTQKSWMAVKKGTNDWRLFANSGDGYNFVDSDLLDATKFGIVLKRGTNASYKNMDVSQVIVTKGNLITVSNLLPGQKAQLITDDGTIVSEDVAFGGTAVRLNMPSLKFEGTLRVLTDEDVTVNELSATFYGGDLYSIGTTVQVRLNETELDRATQTDLGVMYGGTLEVLMDVFNPSNVPATNVVVAVSQYSDKFGWEWADVALDVAGVPGAYADQIFISSLLPNTPIPFWVKVTKQNTFIGLESLQFNIHIEHD